MSKSKISYIQDCLLMTLLEVYYLYQDMNRYPHWQGIEFSY